MASDPPRDYVAHRRFQDSDGRFWDLWEIAAGGIRNAGSSYDRRHSSRDSDESDPLATGWLCFESRGERRRFAPIPYGWELLSDDLLGFLLGISEPVKRLEGSETIQEPPEI
jgi:hypothetical protein